jgi:hypothetical protein
MTEEFRDKLKKIYELVNKGSTDGERAAAKQAIDRLLDKYNLTMEDLIDIDKKRYIAKYTSVLEFMLLLAILKIMTDDGFENTYRLTFNYKPVREVAMYLTYLDWVTVESAYEYFRRHMKAEWERLCLPQLKKCRKAKTRNKLRKELQLLFFDRYSIESRLYKEGSLVQISYSEMSQKEIGQRIKLVGVQGGNFNRQVTRGLYLNNRPDYIVVDEL